MKTNKLRRLQKHTKTRKGGALLTISRKHPSFPNYRLAFLHNAIPGGKFNKLVYIDRTKNLFCYYNPNEKYTNEDILDMSSLKEYASYKERFLDLPPMTHEGLAFFIALTSIASNNIPWRIPPSRTDNKYERMYELACLKVMVVAKSWIGAQQYITPAQRELVRPYVALYDNNAKRTKTDSKK
jgi:hypothetical protein